MQRDTRCYCGRHLAILVHSSNLGGYVPPSRASDDGGVFSVGDVSGVAESIPLSYISATVLGHGAARSACQTASCAINLSCGSYSFKVGDVSATEAARWRGRTILLLCIWSGLFVDQTAPGTLGWTANQISSTPCNSGCVHRHPPRSYKTVVEVDGVRAGGVATRVDPRTVADTAASGRSRRNAAAARSASVVLCWKLLGWRTR